MLLGIPRYCSDISLIRRRFKEQIKFFHPDAKNVSEEIALEKTQLLTKCYRTLSDNNLKEEYDRNLNRFYKEQERKQSEKKAQNTSGTTEEKADRTGKKTERAASGIKKTQNGITFEILRTIGTISTSNRGWSKEINIVSWNGRQGKYDIRDWAPDYEKMGKGVTLTEQEARNLYRILKNIFK